MRIRNGVYLDHQASTPVDQRVLDAMAPYWRDKFGNPHSSEHALGWEANAAIMSASDSIAHLLGADSDEIVFTSGATESNNLALFGVARGISSGSKRRRIIVSAAEHKCILSSAKTLEHHYKFQVEIIPINNNGLIKYDLLEEMMDDDVLLISAILTNNEIGSNQDISRLSSISKKYGSILHCDAAQSPCSKDIDVYHDGIDLLSLSGHKMYGPKGIGALYINRTIKHNIEPLIYGGGQQENARSGTLPAPLCVGMGVAAELIDLEGSAERERIAIIRNELIATLQASKWKIQLNGPPLNHRHPGNANLQFVGFNAQDIIATLQPKVFASTGSACTSGITEPSHVLRAIGLSTEEAESSIRFSVGRETTRQDVHNACDYIFEALQRLQPHPKAI